MKICQRKLHSYEGRRCIECQKIKIKEWNEKNKEIMVVYYQGWHQKHKVRRNNDTKKRYEANKEHFKAYGKQYREDNKEIITIRYNQT